MIDYKNGGRIVNMSSLNGLTGIGAKSGSGHYSMAKSAVINMTKTSAIEYISDKIRINCVCPTAVNSELLQEVIRTSPDPEQEGFI